MIKPNRSEEVTTLLFRAQQELKDVIPEEPVLKTLLSFKSTLEEAIHKVVQAINDPMMGMLGSSINS